MSKAQISQISVDGKSFFLPPTDGQHFKDAATLKTPLTGDWYIYFNIWDFEEAKWKPQKFYSKFLNNKEALALKPKDRLAKANVILEECNKQLKEGINPKTTLAIAPFSDKTLKTVLEDLEDTSNIPRLKEAIDIYLQVKSDKVGKKEAAENKENTATTYKYFFKQFENYCIKKGIDNQKVNKFTKQQVQEFFSGFLTSGQWSALTHNSNLGFIKTFFNYFAKRYDFTHYINNIEDVEVTEETEKFEPFNLTDVKRVFDFLSTEHIVEYPHYTRTMPSSPFLALVSKVIFYSFIRPSEIRRLKVKHIKRYKQGYFDLTKDITKNKKVEARFKELYLDDVLVTEFSKLGWENYFNDKKFDNYYVFTPDLIPSPTKTSTYQFGKAFARALDKMDARRNDGETNFADAKYSLYSLKHTGNIEAYKAGWTIAQLQLQNRHSSEDQTENYLRELKQEINLKPRPTRLAI